MSNSINHRGAATHFASLSGSIAETHQAPIARVAAETQDSIFERPATAHLIKRSNILPASNNPFKSAPRKKAQSVDFTAPEDAESQSKEVRSQLTEKLVSIFQSGSDDQSENAFDSREESLLVYQSKLDQLNEICRPGMSASDATQAKELAMQVVLCVNAATMVQKKSTRQLSEVVVQMVKKLAQGGVSLPADTENLLSLLKTQSAQLPNLIRQRLLDKSTITGHLLPLLLLTMRRQSPPLPMLSSNMMYQGIA